MRYQFSDSLHSRDFFSDSSVPLNIHLGPENKRQNGYLTQVGAATELVVLSQPT